MTVDSKGTASNAAQGRPPVRSRGPTKKHSKRMATVAAVHGVAPFVRSPEEFLQSLRLRSPGAKPRVVRPRLVAKRVWASLERDPWEVVTEATLEAERHPEHVKRWVPLVDGAETQLDLVEASAAAYGVDVTVVLDIIHVAAAMRRAATVAAWMQLTGARWCLVEAPGATSQPRPRCVLGLPRSARVPAEPRPAIR